MISFCPGQSKTSPPPRQGASLRPVRTYSIVARDLATGQMGVAVRSHWFSVGAIVPGGLLPDDPSVLKRILAQAPR